MIVIKQCSNEDNRSGLAAPIDADRMVFVFENGDAFWIEFRNGTMRKSLAVSREAADALFYLLGVKLGYIEDQA